MPPLRAGDLLRKAVVARIQTRHRMVVASFVAVVVAPMILLAGYLYLIAADQYASRSGFTVRSEELSVASDLMGGLSMLTKASSSDTDVLYQFLQSQALVERIGARLDLLKMFSRPAFDPVFAFDPEDPIEDLVDYWRQMVRPSYAPGTGLIELEVRAFTPEDAQRINSEILVESTEMINQMSAIARSDATRYAREDLDVALGRLKAARQALMLFRSKTRIVDPTADIQGQMGLMTTLETQLAQAYIDLNMTLETTSSADDPRVLQTKRRIDVIQNLIEQERTKFGAGDNVESGTTAERDYPTLIGEFERLSVDLEYASKAYLVAMASMDAANAEAQRQSRYLATYAAPSMPQSSIYPERGSLLGVAGLLLVLIWSTGVLIYYSLRDRR